MAQLGVFLIPPAEHLLYRLASAIVGYDIWARRRLRSSLADDLDDQALARWIGEASIFGFHATIAGAALSYEDADIAEIQARLAWIASRTAPFNLVSGRIHESFHANPQALVTTFDSPDSALLRLHRQVATMVSPLHVSSAYDAVAERLDAEGYQIYVRTGEPVALARYSPHWTLASGLPDLASWDTLRHLVLDRTGLFADDRTRALRIDHVHLVRRGDDGHFAVAASYQLTGR
jgi:hypothetical protein